MSRKKTKIFRSEIQERFWCCWIPEVSSMSCLKLINSKKVERGSWLWNWSDKTLKKFYLCFYKGVSAIWRGVGVARQREDVHNKTVTGEWVRLLLNEGWSCRKQMLERKGLHLTWICFQRCMRFQTFYVHWCQLRDKLS